MDVFRECLFVVLNAILLIIILSKWIRFRIFKIHNHNFSDCYYYKKYEIINSRNSGSKKNKIIQNYLSLLFICVFFLEIILIVIFKF